MNQERNNKYIELSQKKFKEYKELQDKARIETDIEKRNEMLVELNKLNINLKALNIIFEESRLDVDLKDIVSVNN